MLSTRHAVVATVALFFLCATAWTLPAQALDDELTGEHLEPLLPEAVSGFTLESIDSEVEPTTRAEYRAEDGEASLTIAIAYGQPAADEYLETRGRLSMAGAEGQAEIDEMLVGGRTFVGAQMGGGAQAIMFKYFDGFLVGVQLQGADDPTSILTQLFDQGDLDQFSEWSPPEGAEYAAADDLHIEGTDCYSMECFDEHVSQCESARLVGALGRNVTAMYTIEDQLAGDQCQLSFVFADNPNPDWVGAPLYFTVDPTEGFSTDEVEAVMDACQEGDEAYNCEGPLLELIQ